MAASATAAKPTAKARRDWHRVSPGEPAHIFSKNGVSVCGAVRADTRYAYRMNAVEPMASAMGYKA